MENPESACHHHHQFVKQMSDVYAQIEGKHENTQMDEEVEQVEKLECMCTARNLPLCKGSIIVLQITLLPQRAHKRLVNVYITFTIAFRIDSECPFIERLVTFS